MIPAILRPMDRPRERASSHYASCPHCSRSAFIGFTRHEAHVFGGCVHVVEVARSSRGVTVAFEAKQ